MTAAPSRAANLVVLYNPHFVATADRGNAVYRATPPLSQLALAGPLIAAGYDVLLVDGRWDANWRDILASSLDRLLCLGVSSLTGPAVSDGLEVAGYLRTLSPDIPIVWGGWHSTFAAAQAVHDPRVDIVVRGMGERTFVELLDALRGGRPWHDIAGITFRDGDRVVSTPDRPAEDVNHFPPPAWSLIEPSRYIVPVSDGRRMAGVIFSRGCPYACDFCLDSRTKVLGVSIDRMVEEIEFWIARGANYLRFFDGNFFLGRQRILDFCRAVTDRGLERRFRWAATGVGHRMARLEDDVLAQLAAAGLDQVALGAESGSDDLLQRITNKTTVADTTESVKRLAAHGINAFLFFVVGYPDEPADTLDRTFDLVLNLKRINPAVDFVLNFTTPLPGSRVYQLAVERGLVEAPASFADWSRFDYLHPNMQMPDDYAVRVRHFVTYCHLAFPKPGAPRGLRDTLRWPLRTIARWRLDHRRFDWPIELAVHDAVRARLAPRPGPAAT